MIQRLCERSGLGPGKKVVPTSRLPPSSVATRAGCCADRIEVAMPAAAASCAARSFVAIPPVPHCEPPPTAQPSTDPMSCTTRIGSAGASPGASGALGFWV